MRYLILSFILFFTGCATVQTPGYISRMDHPYERKIYGSFEKVVSSLNFILKEQGWTISEEAEPSLYERDERYDNNGYRNLVIITDDRSKPLHLAAAHLNIFIHSILNVCDVEIRYESKNRLIKQLSSTKNDQVVPKILDALEQEVNR